MKRSKLSRKTGRGRKNSCKIHANEGKSTRNLVLHEKRQSAQVLGGRSIVKAQLSTDQSAGLIGDAGRPLLANSFRFVQSPYPFCAANASLSGFRTGIHPAYLYGYSNIPVVRRGAGIRPSAGLSNLWIRRFKFCSQMMKHQSHSR